MITADAAGAVPSWAQLAGWLATPTVRTATGRWRAGSGGAAEGTFAYRAPDDWHRTWDDGRAHDDDEAVSPLRWARPDQLAGGPDRWALAEPVTAARHDGRLCWRAHVTEPWAGAVVLLVDDETGLCLSASEASGSWREEVLDLVVDPELPDELFDAAIAQRRLNIRERRLRELIQERPVPTPHWFPWRPSSVSRPGWRTAGGHNGGRVTRVRAGQPVPRPPSAPDAEPTAVERDGWVYVVAGVDEATAAMVVDQIVEGRPYAW